MSVYTDLIVPPTLEAVCRMRDEVLAKVAEGRRLMDEADEALMRHFRYAGLPGEAKPRMGMDETRRRVDASLWRMAFDMTGLMQVMDAEAKKKFFHQVEKEAPPFTMETVRSTLLSVMQDAETMFARGLVNVFRGLSRDHRTNTNEPFKINRRAILTSMVQSNFSGGLTISYRSYASETLNDIDRVFRVLDGQPHVARSLETAMNAAFSKGEEFVGDYCRARAFMNGNLHLQFTRQDLLDKGNRIIHDYYKGVALAAGRPGRPGQAQHTGR